MADPFIGEIKIVSFGFAPRGWAQCNGQVLPINQNQALFSLLGTTYGGDGRVNFALPDLRSRAPVHSGNGVTLGQLGGAESVTLGVNQLPAHSHVLSASSDVANASIPGAALPAAKPRGGLNRYAAAGSSNTALDRRSLTTAPGGSQSHNNLQPYAVLNYVIALAGIFPSQT